jgi:hypothetical protein
MKTWELKWEDGYVDLFPGDLFAGEGAPNTTHAVSGPRGGLHWSPCSIETHGRTATIDYTGSHRAANERMKFWIGRLRLTFSSDARTTLATFIEDGVRVTRAEWQEENTHHWEPHKPEVSVSESALLPDIDVQEGGSQLVRHLRIERDRRIIKLKKDHLRRQSIPFRCEVCSFDFAEVYGEHGRDFCHRMIHRHGLLSLRDLKAKITKKIDGSVRKR